MGGLEDFFKRTAAELAVSDEPSGVHVLFGSIGSSVGSWLPSIRKWSVASVFPAGNAPTFPGRECPDLSRPGMPRPFPAGNAQTFPGRECPDLSRPGMARPFPAGNGQNFPGRECQERQGRFLPRISEVFWLGAP